MEIMASWSVNFFANQTPPTTRKAFKAFSKKIKNLVKKVFKSVNVWRAFRVSDLAKHFLQDKNGQDVLDKDGKKIPLTRAHIAKIFIEDFNGSDEKLFKFFTETLKLHCYVAFQYEGDTIVTTHFGFHDVMYFGGPSYQVTSYLMLCTFSNSI